MADNVAHARLSPSGSKRWMACPGSVTLEAPFPDTSSAYSDSGTAMHAVAAWCLTEHRRAHLRISQQIPVHHDGEEPRFVEFTDEMATTTQEYVDTVCMLGIGNTLQIEQRVDFSPFIGVADQFGTADAIVWNDREGELMLIDLKTGYKFVDVEENGQLLCYALGALKQIVEGAGTATKAHAEGDEPDEATAGFLAQQSAAIIGEVDEKLATAGAAVCEVPSGSVSETPQSEESQDDELW